MPEGGWITIMVVIEIGGQFRKGNNYHGEGSNYVLKIELKS